MKRTWEQWEAVAIRERDNSLKSNFRRAEAIFHMSRDDCFWGQYKHRHEGEEHLDSLCDGLAIECYEDLADAINYLPKFESWKELGKFSEVIRESRRLKSIQEPRPPKSSPKPRPTPIQPLVVPKPKPTPAPDDEQEMPWEFDDELQKHAGSLTHEQRLAMLLLCVHEIESVFGIPHKTATAKIRHALESRRLAIAGH